MANELQFRSTIVAVKKETTQNTIVEPAAGTDFVPILDDFTITSSFDEIENPEVQPSIGMSKSNKGFENPTSNISLLFKHSGVEGQAPNWGPILESCLGSAAVVASTEYDTVSSSTTTVAKVDSGEGVNFQYGQALMVKDSSMTNGYQIRNISSVSTDDLNLAQALPSAPAAGINLGKAVLYKPANSGHPTLSLWAYTANGGAIQLMGGTRVTSLDANVSAGQAIQATYSLEGIEYYYDPMIVSAANKFIDFNEGGSEISVSVAEKVYKDPYELAEAIQTAMDNGATANITCSYSDSTKKFTITSDGATLNILWKTGTHGADNTDTHIGTLIGFDDTADDGSALTYASDNALVLTAPYSASFDDIEMPIAKNNQVLLGGQTDISCFRASTFTFNVTNEHTKIDSLCDVSGRSGSLFTGRTVTIDITSYLEAGQAEEFKKFRANDTVIFTYNFGEKSGGNWVPGTCGNIHIPRAVITAFDLPVSNGIVTLQMTLKAFVEDGKDEVFVNML